MGEHLRRATDAGLSWPLPAELDDAQLGRLLSRQLLSYPLSNAAYLIGQWSMRSCARRASLNCRRSRFETLDRSALNALPANAYIVAQWAKARVNIDYHVEVDRHYYSVPNAYRKKQVDVRYTEHTVECFYNSQRIASHTRSQMIGHHTTVRERLPESHRQYGDWSPDRLISWAHKYAKCTAELVNQIMQARRHPEQGYRSCLGILRLEKTYGAQLLEAACQRALLLGTRRYKSVESILKYGLDQIDPVDAKPSYDSLPVWKISTIDTQEVWTSR